MVENFLDLYERFLYPFEVLSAISRKRNGELAEEELAQLTLNVVGSFSLEELIQPLDVAMDCAEACVVLIIESLQQLQDCTKGNNSRYGQKMCKIDVKKKS